MRIKLFSVVMGIALSATILNASAQKAYTEGLVTYKTSMRGQDVETKEYFKPDSTAVIVTAGPATIKLLTDSTHQFFAVLIDVPVASIKKAAIANPSEIDQMMSGLPTFTFTPTTETKQISGFNCEKVQAKDNKTGTSYDVWITKDISTPPTAIPVYYREIGGFPVQYTAFQQGQGGQGLVSTDIITTAVTDDKAPDGTFTIGPDFDKITMDDLKAMSGGGN